MGKHNRLARPLTLEAELKLLARRNQRAKIYMREKYANGGKEQKAKWRLANPGRELSTRRKAKYQITQQQWDELFKKQNYQCGICGTDEPGGKAGWATDHDHVTGKIRGILCQKHNKLLGMMGDDLSGALLLYEQISAYLRGDPCITPGGRKHLSITDYIVNEHYNGWPMDNETQFKEFLLNKKVKGTNG